MKLHQQINEQVKIDAVITANVHVITEHSEITTEQLNEAVTHWLANLRSVIGKGTFDETKKPTFAMILGSLIALSDPVNIDALNIKKSELLRNFQSVTSPDKQASGDALRTLQNLGRDPSISGYVDQAKDLLDNPEELNTASKKLQVKLNRIMDKISARMPSKPEGTPA